MGHSLLPVHIKSKDYTKWCLYRACLILRADCRTKSKHDTYLKGKRVHCSVPLSQAKIAALIKLNEPIICQW